MVTIKPKPELEGLGVYPVLLPCELQGRRRPIKGQGPVHHHAVTYGDADPKSITGGLE